jgi:1-acyl-sn-glycerol-3-phosphate acyltransferase
VIVLRSLTFQIAFYVWTVMLVIASVPLLAMSRRMMQAGTRFWLRGPLVLATMICGIRYRVEGSQWLPAGAAVIAAKHQSAWDTMIFHQLLDDPVFAVKRELFAIPLVGGYMRKAGCIRIDRSSPVRAMRTMIAGATQALAEGRQVVVFPEGTRVAPGARQPYHAGIKGLYGHGEVPVIPVALNSGVFWGRRSFLKYPGMITVQILPPMPAGLDRDSFLHALKERIETASERLCAEADQQLPPQWRLAKRGRDAPRKPGDGIDVPL